jgi:hypothetical protein
VAQREQQGLKAGFFLVTASLAERKAFLEMRAFSAAMETVEIVSFQEMWALML